MNARKRNGVLLGFGGLAAVLLVALGFWPPNFKSEDASGAIGAVQKLHTTQITPKDVVLVDEPTRQAQTVLYGGFLADAAKLESMSAALASRDAQAGSNANLESIAKGLQSHSADLQSRYVASMTESLASMKQFLARDASLAHRNLGSIQNEIESLGARLQSAPHLGSAEMESLNSKLADITQELESMKGCPGGCGSLSSSTNLGDVQAELGTAVSQLEAAKLDNNAVLGASAKIANVARDLASRASFGVNFANRQQYLGSMALEAKTLNEAEAALNASMAARSQVGSSEQLGARLNNVAAALASRASELQARAIENMDAQLNAQTAFASSLQSMNTILASARNLESRANGVESNTMQSFNRELGNLAQELQSKNAEFQSRAAADMQFELGAISARLDSRDTLNASMASRSQLGAKMESHSELAHFASLGSMQKELASISQSMESLSKLGVHFANQAQLSSMTQTLASRTAEFQSRNQ